MNPSDILTLESLPNELLFDVALRLDDRTLLELCRVSRRFDELCHDEIFWRHRFHQRFPNFITAAEAALAATPNSSWHELYLSAIRSPDSLWRLRFEHEFPEFVEAAEAERNGRTGRSRTLIWSSEMTPEQLEFALKPTLSWLDLYQYALRSPLMRSPEFRNLYQAITSQFPTIRFNYHPQTPPDETYLPTLFIERVGPPIYPTPIDATVIILFPRIPYRRVQQSTQDLRNSYLTDLYSYGGLGPVLLIRGNLVKDRSGNIIWVPARRRSLRPEPSSQPQPPV